MPNASTSNIHYQRRWFYVLWTSLLMAGGCFWIWMEQPAASRIAELTLVVSLQEAPTDCKASLWIGRTDDFREDGSISKWQSIKDGKIAVTSSVHLNLRHLGQGYILKKTDDFAVLILEASGKRRYWVYDLREDIKSGLLRNRKTLSLSFTKNWGSFPSVVRRPDSSERHYIGW